jgi:CHAT domain-containing protein
VPDGALHRVSFASLPANDGKYLAEKDPVLEYLSAERDLVPGAAPASEGGDILLVGDPDFDAAAGSPPDAVPEKPEAEAAFGCGGLKGVRFEALAATREEVRDVRAIWEESDSPAISELTGSEATESAVKSLIPGARVVHLATHGFVLDGTCGKRIKNSRGIQSYSRRRTGREGPRANPLQLAGLALAGANLRERAAPEDDGILTAEELSSLDLSAADLVVLSACETGLGRIEATEGVVGIRRSLQIAGAGNLIMSLWAVEDTSTREWMADLYHALLREGVDVPGAVQRAQRARIAAGRDSDHGAHPFFWAGFVSSGASRQGRFGREERRSR